MSAYDELIEKLKRQPKSWLVTGVAGFIGSNLLEALLAADQKVLGFDNFETGRRENLLEVKCSVTDKQWANFKLIDGDITDPTLSDSVCKDVDYVLHQAALGSVPRSFKNPAKTNQANVAGFLNLIDSAARHNVKAFVYASSSSVYGDSKMLPKVETIIGSPLSPYAVTKRVNELYAHVFASQGDMKTIGLRYFNVFGKRQDPDGVYAAVIPRWILAMIKADPITINGDGSNSRDFCYIDNVVQANILAACVTDTPHQANVFNVACADRHTLMNLFKLIKKEINELGARYNLEPVMGPERPGDIPHSHADIASITSNLGYVPKIDLALGLKRTCNYYVTKNNGLDLKNN